jgi:hypothetical protein
MKLKIANNRKSIIMGLGIGCVVCLLLGFGILLHAQDKTKAEFIAAKPGMNAANMKKMNTAEMKEMNTAKVQAMAEEKEQAAARGNRSWGRQNRERVDFGENAAFYKVIIDNNLFRPLGWTPPNNEPAYSLIGTAIGADGGLSQATLLEKRSNRYHFVTIGTKLGDMTVKDIQAKQVTLDKAGKPIALKAGELQFLTTSRGRDGSRGEARGEGGSEKESNNNAGQNRGKQTDDAKQKQMEQQKQAAQMMEKMKNASEEERREIMQQMRRGRTERGGRRGRNRDR